jgi:methylenetetrahydrofolate reductase (NADH)
VKISELVGRGGPVVSFEFFPPKTAEGEASLMRTIEALRPLRPSFVSVTRTGGKPREATIELVARIRALGIEGAAHVTAIEATRDEIAGVLDLLGERGIENMVALRGDVPNDPAFRRPADGFGYAVDMIRFVRERTRSLCLVGAGHPEGHPECRDLALSIEHLKMKVDAGLDLVITQLFYDNADFFRFEERCRELGIAAPIIPGILPVTNLSQIQRITLLCKACLPEDFVAELSQKDDPDWQFAVGVRHATRQVQELIDAGVPGMHFYVLNKSPATAAVLSAIKRP